MCLWSTKQQPMSRTFNYHMIKKRNFGTIFLNFAPVDLSTYPH